MHLRSLKLKYTAVGWLIFFIGAACLLPSLDSRLAENAVLRSSVLACGAVLVIVTCITAFGYLKNAWSKAGSVANRGTYLIWISLETLAAVLVLAGVLVIIGNTYAVRTEIRWFARSSEFKTRVLAQPEVTGQLKHIEWDGWGGVAVGDWTVYVVFDPTDSLSAAASRHSSGRFSGIPCDVDGVRRLEDHWYSVTLAMNEWWEQCE